MAEEKWRKSSGGARINNASECARRAKMYAAHAPLLAFARAAYRTAMVDLWRLRRTLNARYEAQCLRAASALLILFIYLI